MFKSTSLSSEERVTKFLREIEKRPCIYDTSVPKFKVTPEAWKEISIIMDSTVSQCKDRWRKLRLSYIRSIKSQSSTPYYLADKMEFLKPFIKVSNEEEPKEPVPVSEEAGRRLVIKNVWSETGNGQTDNLTPKVEIIDDHDVANGNFDDYSTDEDNLESKQPMLEVNASNLNTAEEKNKRIAIVKQENVRKRRRSNSASPGNDPRQMFILSLMPDINAMTDQEMRTFRRQIVNCIDNIFQARENN